jgi:hypothetical protein
VTDGHAARVVKATRKAAENSTLRGRETRLLRRISPGTCRISWFGHIGLAEVNLPVIDNENLHGTYS